MDNKTKEAIKQLQAELKQLQVALVGSRDTEMSAAVADNGQHTEASRSPKKDKDVVVQCTVRLPTVGDAAAKKLTIAAGQSQIGHVTDEAAATLGNALASPQKIALLRALLGKDVESSTNLGKATSLTTGSLYHHLRELMHADLIHQQSRSQYALTERGAGVLLTLLALAAKTDHM